MVIWPVPGFGGGGGLSKRGVLTHAPHFGLVLEDCSAGPFKSFIKAHSTDCS